MNATSFVPKISLQTSHSLLSMFYQELDQVVPSCIELPPLLRLRLLELIRNLSEQVRCEIGLTEVTPLL